MGAVLSMKKDNLPGGSLHTAATYIALKSTAASMLSFHQPSKVGLVRSVDLVG